MAKNKKLLCHNSLQIEALRREGLSMNNLSVVQSAILFFKIYFINYARCVCFVKKKQHKPTPKSCLFTNLLKRLRGEGEIIA